MDVCYLAGYPIRVNRNQDMSHRPSGACANDGLIASITKLVYSPGHRLVDALRKPDAGRIVKHVPCIGTIVNKRNHSEVVDLYKAWVVHDRPETERAVHRGIGVDFAMSEDITQKILAERDGLAQNAVLKRNGCQTVYSACRNRVC